MEAEEQYCTLGNKYKLKQKMTTEKAGNNLIIIDLDRKGNLEDNLYVALQMTHVFKYDCNSVDLKSIGHF